MNNSRSILLKTMLPVAIGTGVILWLFSREFSVEQWKTIPWTLRTFAAIALGALFVCGREWGMMWRFRALTDRKLTWRGALTVTMQCEFTSAITPTTAGGSSLSMVFLNRQGIPLGRATIITMIVLMLDELFIVLACPLIFLLFQGHEIFGFAHAGAFTTGVRVAFWIVYGGVCAVTLFLFMGAFVFPRSIAQLISRIFKFKLLRRWHRQAVETGISMTEAGADLRKRSAAWWMEAMAATAFTWICRYLVVNALFWGFAQSAPQTVVFARQFIVWTLLTISPTPGGSGLSEWLFTGYYGDLITDSSMVLVMAILWRMLTYYVYLAVGVCRLPAWLKKSPRHK